jgi:hypothetical protein
VNRQYFLRRTFSKTRLRRAKISEVASKAATGKAPIKTSAKMSNASQASATLVVSVVNTASQTQTYFKVKQSTKLKKLIDCYAKREGIHSPDDVCFFIKDEHERPVLCEEQMTPSSLLLQEGDKIWCSAARKAMP